MKRLLIAIFYFISLGVQAQDKTLTVRKTISGLIYGADPSALRDTIPAFRLTGLANGMLPVYNSTTKKWHATAFSVGILPGLLDSLGNKANRNFDNVASGAIPIAKLAASTISGVNLGGNLANLSAGTGLSFSAYNGGTARTANADTTVLQTILNFFPKGDTRYAKISTLGSYLPLSAGSGNALTGTLTSVLGNNTILINSQSATTGFQYINIKNTSGWIQLGIEGSSAGNMLTSGSAYAGVFTTVGAKNLEFGTDQILGLKIDGSNRKITIPELGGAGDVIVGSNNSGLLGEITIGSGLSLSSGVLTATGGSSGSVTTSGGTAGKIVKFTSASNVENSIMTENSTLLDVAGDIEADIITANTGYKYNFGSSNRGGIYGLSTLTGSGSDWTPSYYSESGLGAKILVDGSTTKGVTFATSGNATFSGTITASNLSGTNTGDQTNISGTAGNATLWNNYANDFASGVRTLTISSIVGKYSDGTFYQFDAASTANFISGQTFNTLGNAATATALQTGRTISGTLFDGTANITLNNTGITNGAGYITASSSNTLTNKTGNISQWTNDSGYITSSALSTYAPLASPTFTGTVSGITAAMVGAPSGSGTSTGTNTGDQNLTPYALLASPAFTGNPTAPTQAIGDNSTKIATTAYVDAYSPFPIFDSGTIILSGNGSTAIFDTGIAESTSITAPNLMIASAYEQAAKIAWSLGLVANGSGGNNWTINFATPPASGTNNVKFNYILVMP